MTDHPRIDFTRSRAVLVGTWDYTDLPPVPAVEHSFSRMVELLTSDLCGWPAERVTQWTNQRQPGDLPRRLIDLFGDADDVALFYFVGHGQSDDRGRLCLGLAETSGEPRFRGSTSLKFEDVRTALHYSNARTKIVLLDCCFAGLATQPEAALGGVDVAGSAVCEGAYTIAASAEYDVARYEQSDDRVETPQTYFTKCLCDTVRDGIADQGPALSLEAIFRHLVSAMESAQLARPTQANRGTASTFPFARNVAARWTSLPTGIVDAMRNPLAGVRTAVVSTLAELAASAGAAEAEAATDALNELAEHDADAHVRNRATLALTGLPFQRLADNSDASTAAQTSPVANYVVEQEASRRRRSRLVVHLRSRVAVASVVLAMVAAAVYVVSRDHDALSGDGASSGPLTTSDYRPTGSKSEQIDNLVIPPPLPADYPPPEDSGEPDADYQQETTCVQSGSDTYDVETSWGQARFDFTKLHPLATGQGQTVAVIDTGVNPHPLFDQRVRHGNDYVSTQEPPDCDGHGTEVAGLIAANAENISGDTDFQGVAPAASVLAIRQSSANFVVQGSPDSDTHTAGNPGTLAQAVVSAADADADVIAITVTSCRLASTGPIAAPEQMLQAALRYAVETKNAVVIVSAGDSSACQNQNNTDPNRPAVIPMPAWFSEDVLTVAAVTRKGKVADFSVRGPWVDVAAPGTEITTLNPASTGLVNQQLSSEGDSTPIEGTSYAAAYVAGLAALVRQHRPNLDARQVMNRIKHTAEHPNAAGGWNDKVGFGVVQPVEALTAMVPDE
jgi:membrane-anchored mycosin MYCP